MSVPVSVRDRNRSVAGLTAADFEVLDNGVPQDITSTLVETLPVDVTLVLDTSGSVTGRTLATLKDDVQHMSDRLRPSDRVRLITFAKDVSDAFGLQPGGAHVSLDRVAASGVTSLYSALAAALIAAPSGDRPQLIFALSDGLDTVSFLDADQVVRLARLSGACLYIAVVPPSDNAELRVTRMMTGSSAPGANAFGSGISNWRSFGLYVGGPNRAALRDAAAETGGTLYEDTRERTMQAAFGRALDEFRTTYVLRYTPKGVAIPGSHALTIRTPNARYTVRARPGYDGG